MCAADKLWKAIIHNLYFNLADIRCVCECLYFKRRRCHILPPSPCVPRSIALNFFFFHFFRSFLLCVAGCMLTCARSCASASASRVASLFVYVWVCVATVWIGYRSKHIILIRLITFLLFSLTAISVVAAAVDASARPTNRPNLSPWIYFSFRFCVCAREHFCMLAFPFMQHFSPPWTMCCGFSSFVRLFVRRLAYSSCIARTFVGFCDSKARIWQIINN